MEPNPDITREHQAEENELVARVKAGLIIFVTALKNYALYPDANSIRRASLIKFCEWLEEFWKEMTCLHLDVEQDCLRFQGEAVYQDKPNEKMLAFPLFRDGIEWLEFQDGITADELERFLSLLNRFRVLKEDADDDLVTAMWEAEFSSLQYKAAEEFWDADPIIDIAALNRVQEDIDDEEEKKYVSYMQTAGDTVSLVLGALSKESGGEGDGDDQESSSGAEASISEQLADLFAALDGAKRGRGHKIGLFESRGSDLSDAPEDADPQKERFGRAGQHEGGKARPGGPPSVSAPGQEEGSQMVFSLPSDDDDDDASPSNAATAASLFKTSTYYENQRKEVFWELSPQEEERLRNMIADEENRNTTKDCLEIILILIMSSQGRSDVRIVLSFLADEVQYALARGELHYVQILLERLIKAAAPNRPWLVKMVDELQEMISAPEILGVLGQNWAPETSEVVYKDLPRFLALLRPEAINTLAPLYIKSADPRLKAIYMEAIAAKAGDINFDIAPLISTMPADSIMELMGFFADGRFPFPKDLIMLLTRNETPRVRYKAVQILLDAYPEELKKLYHMVRDADPDVNRMICEHIGKRRDPLAENYLMQYLNNAYEQNIVMEREHILNCYRAFGGCASNWSIPFLQEILLKKDWKSLLGLEGHWHRLGAALALMLMPKEWGTGDILQMAAKSRYRNIRQAMEQAGEELYDAGY
ncbi:MAG: HEAT repeat domain-containing protein [Candidatus Adiutrix sp.]|jgi:hypothetical protein|nr:HEAT repeat domain-containing protein [Candidatus Adiutrix sp.]